MPPFWRVTSRPQLEDTLQALHSISDKCAVLPCDSPEGHDANGSGSVTNTKYFLRAQDFERCFDRPKLAKLLKDILRREDHTRLASKIVNQGYVRVFLILLLQDKAGFIEFFFRCQTLRDANLPFSKPAPAQFPRGVDFDDFYITQQAFCAPKFSPEMELELADDCILPIREVDRIAPGHGESGEIVKIKLSQGHDELDEEAVVEATFPHTYILKGFRIADKEALACFQREKDAYDRLQLSSRIDNLARCYGSFTYRGRAYLILEYASQGTLEQFMQSTRPPEDAIGRAALYRNLLGLGKALSEVHSCGGCHHDIQPLNIVVSKTRFAGRFDFSFKLIDLGRSVFMDINDRSARHRDSYGTRTYGAPETYRVDSYYQNRQLHVTRDIDVFSLACVWLEVVVWTVDGWGGVERFRQRRSDEIREVPGMETIPFFHDGSRLLRCIRATIQEFELSRNHLALSVCQRLIQPMLCENPSHRLAAEELWKKALQILPEDDTADPHHVVSQAQTLETLLCNTALDENASDYAAQRPRPSQAASSPSRVQEDHDPGLRFLDHSRRVTTLPPERKSAEEDFMNGTYNPIPTPRNPPSSPPDGLSRSNTLPASSRSASQLQRSTAGTSNGAAVPIQGQQPPVYTPVPYLSVAEVSSWLRARERGIFNQLTDETFCKAKLKRRDHVFIMDNTWSTARYWNEMCELMYMLSSIVEDCDPDGSDIYFTTDGTTTRGAKPEKLHHLAKQITASNDSNLEERPLEPMMKDYMRRLKELRRLQPPVELRPISVYILTDGRWRYGNPEVVFLSVQQELDDLSLPREQVGFQFIRFGNDPEGKKRLQDLDDMEEKMGLHLDVIDTEPHTQNVWKMLLGAIDARFDKS